MSVQMDSKQQYQPVDLYYQVWIPKKHDPELSPIIFLHGAAALHNTWNGVGLKIADITKRKVYALDLRNHGQSEWSEDNTLHHHRVDIENFLSENGISKCILVGHSLGGKISLFFALMRPELIEKVLVEEVALSDPSADDLEGGMQLIETGMKIVKLRKDLKEADIKNLLSKMIQEKYPKLRDFTYSAPLRRTVDGTIEFDFNLDVIARTFRDKTAFEIDYSECKKFDGPILVMFGEGSYFKVGNDERIKEYFPNVEFCTFKTCEHVLHADRPDEFITYVSNFINK